MPRRRESWKEGGREAPQRLVLVTALSFTFKPAFLLSLGSQMSLRAWSTIFSLFILAETFPCLGFCISVLTEVHTLAFRTFFHLLQFPVLRLSQDCRLASTPFDFWADTMVYRVLHCPYQYMPWSRCSIVSHPTLRVAA